MVWRPFLGYLTQSSVRMSDQCGRLNSTWTVGILVLFAALTFFIQISSDPVNCWTPSQFTHPMTVYTNKVCGESGSYYVGIDKDIPIYRREDEQTFKWRWLPLILLVQALLFKVPDLVLSVGQGLVGLRFTKIIGLTDGYESLNMVGRAQMGRQVGRYVKSWIDSTVLKGCPWGWLTLLFLFTKLLYFINIITQLSVMDGLLTYENQSSFGRQMLDEIVSNETVEWRLLNGPFTRIVFCDFQIRLLETIQRWTVQCTLNNITYYEMVLCFLWLWFVVVSVVTTMSGMLQLLTVLVPVFRKRYIKSYLYLSKEVTPSPSDNDISRFAGSEITEEGVFILKAIGEASSEHLVRDAVIYLWQSTHDQQTPGQLGPPEQGGPPSYLPPGYCVTGQTYVQGGAVISTPPSVASQQVRYRPQPGTETAPLMANQPM
ncbi:innexin unc-7-like isoform X2 [Mizuhopecten yessoensis]|uniref:Innexin n=2 Tax=Mizuhopecten yessoensis TaxID=6573 RepID=A0A210PLR5_MIZYE|nr:innexin unc-7-like isoform X2 [Mizuhopecten yessoensis]XP_021380321.1 innexin unc-7-like isoform X2 [Mizuhopecten yessoensis]OWF37407.1 Innexin unc-7 [Mizuhopecten yessoensis]